MITSETPTRFILQDHENNRIVCQALPFSKRAEFLFLRRIAWDLIEESTLAQVSADYGIEIAVAFLVDNSEDFRWVVSEMLSLHGVNYQNLDHLQVTRLLFRYEGGDGRLVQLEFPPQPKVEDGIDFGGLDPKATMVAILGIKSGDYAAALNTVDSMSYAEILDVLEALNRMSKPAEDEKPKKVTEQDKEWLKEQLAKSPAPKLEKPNVSPIAKPMPPATEEEIWQEIQRFKAEQEQ